MRALYTVGWWLATPLAFVYLLWRSLRQPAYRRHWGERLGRFPPRADDRPLLWIHAVSVGETRAAQPLVRLANRAPVDTFETNIRGTWLLLEACRRSPTVKRIAVASSDKAYGDQDILPYFEAAPLQGRHPYEVSKSCADLIAQAYYTTYRLPVGITRCGNIYGGGDLNWDRIVPGTMRSVLRGEAPVIRSDGTLLRDYLYVADIVEGYLRLAECLEDPALHGQAFNFGMDDPQTVLEVAQAIIAISDYPDLKPVVLNQASHEIAKQYLASEKAHRLLGWRAQYSLAEGLRRTLAWYREFFQK